MELHGSDAEPLARFVEAQSLAVDPPAVVLPRLTACIESAVPDEPVRVLLSPDAAATLSEEFLLESQVAGAMERDHLEMRQTTERCGDRVVLADDRVGVLVGVDQHVRVLSMEADRMVAELHKAYEPLWENAEPVSTRSPPRERLFEAGREKLTAEFTTQLERAIENASTLAWHGRPTPVELTLVIAARTGAHHYDLCAWAEAAEFTSRSTVARTKQRLEDAGLLDVEPVPQERGRPRQQLLVADERLAETEAESLVPTLREQPT